MVAAISVDHRINVIQCNLEAKCIILMFFAKHLFQVKPWVLVRAFINFFLQEHYNGMLNSLLPFSCTIFK